MSRGAAPPAPDPDSPPGGVRIGRVGRPHGIAGAFRVDEATERPGLLDAGRQVTLAGHGPATIAERKGDARRPIVRLEGVDDPRPLRGAALSVDRAEIEVGDDEWLVDDLVGCEVVGMGTVAEVWFGPSAEGLVLDDGRVVPLVADAVVDVDVGAQRIEVDRAWLGER